MTKDQARLDLIKRTWKLPIQNHKQKSVMAFMSQCANPDGSNCFPSVPTISSHTGIGIRDVQRALRGLENAGWIIPTGNLNGGRGKTRVYRLNVPQQLQLDYGNGYVKGDKDDTLYPIREGDHGDIKGDKTGAERVTKPGLKGDKTGGAIRSTSSLPLKPFTINTEQSSGNGHTAQSAAMIVQTWLAIKKAMQQELPAKDWQTFVRPARLLRAMGEQVLLIAFPPNKKIIRWAQQQKNPFSEVAGRFGFSTVHTVYPDDYDRAEAKERYGVEWVGAGKKKSSGKSQVRPPPEKAVNA